MTVTDAALALAVSEWQVRHLIGTGRLKRLPSLGGRVDIDPASVAAYQQAGDRRRGPKIVEIGRSAELARARNRRWREKRSTALDHGA